MDFHVGDLALLQAVRYRVLRAGRLLQLLNLFLNPGEELLTFLRQQFVDLRLWQCQRSIAIVDHGLQHVGRRFLQRRLLGLRFPFLERRQLRGVLIVELAALVDRRHDACLQCVGYLFRLGQRRSICG